MKLRKSSYIIILRQNTVELYCKPVESTFTPEKVHRAPKKHTECRYQPDSGAPPDPRNRSYPDPEEKFDNRRQNDYRSNSSPSAPAELHINFERTQRWCNYCQNAQHSTQTCARLEKCSSTDVINFLRVQELCSSCMRWGHTVMKCPQKSQSSCRKCGHCDHHTFLHEDISHKTQPGVSYNHIGETHTSQSQELVKKETESDIY